MSRSKSRDSDLLDEIKVDRVNSISCGRDDPSKKSPLEPTNSSYLRLRSNTADWRNAYNFRLIPKQNTRLRQHHLLAEENSEDFRTRSLTDPQAQSRVHPDGKRGEKILHSGWLYKTIRTKSLSVERSRHERRQHRRFQLTDHSLRYLQPHQRVWYVFSIFLYLYQYSCIVN